MASTNYTDYTTPAIKAAWLNDVDAVVYTALGNSQTVAALRGFIHAVQTSDNSISNVQAGTLANRPTAGTQNRIYISTDSPITIFLDNGTTWNPLTLDPNGTYSGLRAEATTKTDVGLGSVADALQLIAGNNLNDLTDVPTAQTNLDVDPAGTAIAMAIALG